MKENSQLEWKETISGTFLKTVSAFANYYGGMIIFGINDDGEVVGIDDPEQACLSIENRINDSIEPQPDYTLEIMGNHTIQLKVSHGKQTPYLYHAKAYKRNDTATIEVDILELKRLILEGQNLNYEELRAGNQNLTFTYLEKKMNEVLHLHTFNQDTLKTLNLYSDENGYNHAALILSDHNTMPGIDIAKFGESINIIQKRARLIDCSIIEAYFQAIALFEDYYTYEEIQGIERKRIETIPAMAFREALANAIIHRSWDVSSQLSVAMYDDHIEINSPCGLPTGMKNDDLFGMVSVLKNPILTNVFYRLRLVEMFGTGLPRVMQCYENSFTKPKVNVYENYITIILPRIENNLSLTADEKKVYDVMSQYISKPVSQIYTSSGFGRTKTKGLLKQMEEKGLIQKEGIGKSTKYLIR